MAIAKPKKRLGQHFLRDESIARRIAREMEISASDCLIEIGAGEGALTEALMAHHPMALTAVEIDPLLCKFLRNRFGSAPGFSLIEGNFLNIEWPPNPDGSAKWRVAGNIPYNITSPILFRILDMRDVVGDLTVMVQREVAERLVSEPGCKSYGIPSVLFQMYSTIKIGFHISRDAFYPVPGVDSSVIFMKFSERPLYPLKDEDFFRKMVQTVFGQRRKMLRNTLKPFLDGKDPRSITECDMTRRPEALSIERLALLSNRLVKSK